MPWHSKASSFCPISHKCHSCFQSCLYEHNPEDGEESGGVCTNSQLHQHCTCAVSAGDPCVCASTVPRQKSLTNISCSWTIHWPLGGFPRRLPSAKGGHNACHTGTTNTFLSPGGHRSNALVLQVQQPGHSNFLILPRALVGTYK